MAVAQNRLTVGDEDELHGKVEERPQGLAQLVPRRARPEVAKPGVRAEPHAAFPVAEQTIAGDERAGAGKPDHRLARPRDPERVDPFRERGPPAHPRRVEALHHLVAAAPVPADRGKDGDRLAVGAGERAERLPELGRDERVDQQERVRGRVGNRADLFGPVGRAPRLRGRLPLGVARRPAPQSGTQLLESGYFVSSGGFWTLCSVA